MNTFKIKHSNLNSALGNRMLLRILKKFETNILIAGVLIMSKGGEGEELWGYCNNISKQKQVLVNWEHHK